MTRALDIEEPRRPCQPEEWICQEVFERFDNAWAAWAINWFLAKPLAVLGIILLAVLVRWLLHRLINRLTEEASDGILPGKLSRRKVTEDDEKVTISTTVAAARREQRAQTMGSLLRSISTGVVFAIAAIMVLSEIGVDVAPLIASAGILGVALGFGAQSLVKDFLSGVFLVFEDQFGVGDVVDLGEAVGTVEAFGLRVTRLRDVNGTVWYVRNGEILRVGNQSQNWARTVLDVPVAYDEDLHRVQTVLGEVAHGMWEDEDYQHVIIEEPEVWGVQALTPDAIQVRVVLKTAPLEQWAVAREMRQRIKARFDHEGIEIPLPQRVVWHRSVPERDGAPDRAGAPEA